MNDKYQELLPFLKENREALDNNDFNSLYRELLFLNHDEMLISDFTKLLYDAKINPLLFMESVPTFFLIKNKDIKSIKIPNNIKMIDTNAFGQSSISNIFIPNSIETIGSHAFADCQNLTDIFFENQSKIDYIPSYCFYNNSNIKSIKIPDSVLSIRVNAFSDCISLEDIELSQNIRKIDEYSFYNCKELKQIKFPKSLELLQSRSFAKCSNLETIIFDNCTPIIWSRAFQDCDNIQDIYTTSTIDDSKKYLREIILSSDPTIHCIDGDYDFSTL